MFPLHCLVVGIGRWLVLLQECQELVGTLTSLGWGSGLWCGGSECWLLRVELGKLASKVGGQDWGFWWGWRGVVSDVAVVCVLGL